MEPLVSFSLFKSSNILFFVNLVEGDSRYPILFSTSYTNYDQCTPENAEIVVNTIAAHYAKADGITVDVASGKFVDGTELYSGTLNHDFQVLDDSFGWCASLNAYVPQVVFGRDLGEDATVDKIIAFAGTPIMLFDNVKVQADVKQIDATDEKPQVAAVMGMTLYDTVGGDEVEIAHVRFNEYLADANVVVLLGNGQDRVVAFVRAYNSVFLSDVTEYIKVGLFKTGLSQLVVLAYGNRILASRPSLVGEGEDEYITTRFSISRNVTTGVVTHPILDIYLQTQGEGAMRMLSCEGHEVTYNGYAGWLNSVVDKALLPYNISQFIAEPKEESVDEVETEVSVDPVPDTTVLH